MACIFALACNLQAAVRLAACCGFSSKCVIALHAAFTAVKSTCEALQVIHWAGAAACGNLCVAACRLLVALSCASAVCGGLWFVAGGFHTTMLFVDDFFFFSIIVLMCWSITGKL